MRIKLTYESALHKLKLLEKDQRDRKKYRSLAVSIESTSHQQSKISNNKKEINHLLDFLSGHRAARKLYAENLKLRNLILQQALEIARYQIKITDVKAKLQ